MRKTDSPPRLRGLVGAAVGMASLGIVALLRMPPPPMPPMLAQVLSLHASMVPERAWVDPRLPESAHLERTLDAQISAGSSEYAVHSALFRLGRDGFSLHCTAAPVDWPARALPWPLPDHPEAMLFDADEWLVLGWAGASGSTLIVGDLPARRLLDAASAVACPALPPAAGT